MELIRGDIIDGRLTRLRFENKMKVNRNGSKTPIDRVQPRKVWCKMLSLCPALFLTLSSREQVIKVSLM